MPLRAEFPFRFELQLHHLPPDEAMTSGADGSGARGAVATLLVYEDGNGNGALDFCRRARSRPTPSTRARRCHRALTALRREPHRSTRLPAPANRPAAGARARSGAAAPAAPGVHPEPLTTEIPVPLTADPQLAINMCRGFKSEDGSVSSSPVVCDGADCPAYQVPAGATVRCATDGRAFSWSHCPPEGTLCARNGCSSGAVSGPRRPRQPGGPARSRRAMSSSRPASTSATTSTTTWTSASR